MGHLIPCIISSKSDCHRHSQEGAHDLISLETVGTGKFPGEKRLPETSEFFRKMKLSNRTEFFVEPVNYLFFFWGGRMPIYVLCFF